MPRGFDASDDCIDLASSLFADTFDISYDGISHALTVSAVSSRAPGDEGWTQRIAKPEGNGTGGRDGIDQVEVGLLTTEKAADAEDIKMGGLLGVVGKDEKLSMFISCLQIDPERYANKSRPDNVLLPIAASCSTR